MNFDWNPDTMRWYQAANEYTGFFRKIADIITPKLHGFSTLCDIGCGLGLIDLEFCRHIDHVTCIDINAQAINALNTLIEARHITNIETRLIDCNLISDSWDVIFISFFGSRNLEEFLPRCQKLFAVINTDNDPELYPGKYQRYKKNTVAEAKQYMTEKNISYTLTEIVLEFGQPLLSLTDAENFVRSNSPEITDEELADFLSGNLITTNDTHYPYYLPHTKPIGIFEIEGRG